MVSKDSHAITAQNLADQHFAGYGSGLSGSNTFPHSLGLLPSIQSLGERISKSMDLVHVRAPAVTEESTEMSHTRHLMDLLGASTDTSDQSQRLSLSLGSRMLSPPLHYNQNRSYLFYGDEARQNCNPGEDQQASEGYSFTSISVNRSCSTDGTQSFAHAVGNSRFLRPAQSLLAEVVNIGKNVTMSDERYISKLYHGSRRGGQRCSSEVKAEFCNNGMLSAEKHELHLRVAKLISLLEEVERKYETYCNQMEEVASSFEVIAGSGAAKTYTCLALQAMSRHFGNLRDAIRSHIIMTSRRFSQDSPKISSGLSQLSLFGKEARHHRMSFQQLGMCHGQRQVWRPVRGLPETSVGLLRSWLFEHFLHPYPSDSEKLMLASQTGLNKNQVSNWFINARVRVCKPMIEEMYREEFADSSEDSNPSFATTADH